MEKQENPFPFISNRLFRMIDRLNVMYVHFRLCAALENKAAWHYSFIADRSHQRMLRRKNRYQHN